jgi:hypothetical protein
MKVNKIHVMITHIVTIVTICVDANVVFGPYFLEPHYFVPPQELVPTIYFSKSLCYSSKIVKSSSL